MSIETIMYIIGAICFVFVQARAVFPAEWLAKLPEPLIKLIEAVAGNWGQARNDMGADPLTVKRRQIQ